MTRAVTPFNLNRSSGVGEPFRDAQPSTFHRRLDPMDATKLLKQQHRKVESLFTQYDATTTPAKKGAVFAQIGDALAAHCAIEEKIFYPSAYVGELKDLLKEAVEEHLAAKRLIADLLKMPVTDPNYDAKVKVLKEQIEHHVEEEEGEMFPKVTKNLAKSELDALGEQMEKMFDELMKHAPRSDVPAETASAAPLT